MWAQTHQHSVLSNDFKLQNLDVSSELLPPYSWITFLIAATVSAGDGGPCSDKFLPVFPALSWFCRWSTLAMKSTSRCAKNQHDSLTASNKTLLFLVGGIIYLFCPISCRTKDFLRIGSRSIAVLLNAKWTIMQCSGIHPYNGFGQTFHLIDINITSTTKLHTTKARVSYTLRKLELLEWAGDYNAQMWELICCMFVCWWLWSPPIGSRGFTVMALLV